MVPFGEIKGQFCIQVSSNQSIAVSLGAANVRFHKLWWHQDEPAWDCLVVHGAEIAQHLIEK